MMDWMVIGSLRAPRCSLLQPSAPDGGVAAQAAGPEQLVEGEEDEHPTQLDDEALANGT
jgi:hypothetical protein